MTFFLFLTGLLFITVIASFVAFPLLMPIAMKEPEFIVDEHVTRWEKQKTDAYTAIKEAEFDLQMGKLTPEDYQALRRKYEARALEALTELDNLAKPTRQAHAAERERITSEV